VLSLSEHDPRAGRCWARCEVSFRGADAERTRFESAGAQHLRHVLEKLPGVHRAWQCRHAAHDAQIGPDPAGNYLFLYELDAPENLFDPSLGKDRLAFDGGENAGRHFARLLLKAEPRR
jgi:hypothetical protein